MSKLLHREQCPVCASHGRDNSKDNLAVYDDGHSYCYACNYTTGNSLDDIKYTFEHLAHREISKDAFKVYDVKTAIDPDGKPIRVGFRYPNGSYKIRLFDEKEFFSKPSPTGESISVAGLFGRDRFEAGSHKYVTITEGEYDALALYSVVKAPVLSVQSSSSALRDCSADRAYLNTFERVYLAFDNDVPGREACAAVAKLFDYDKVYHVRFTKHKDANAYLLAGESDELRNLWYNSKRYLPENIISDLGSFKEILGESPKFGVAYPWKTLTDMTYGIRTGETVLITAPEGIGKTEVMHAIEHKLLRETEANVGAIFLEEDKRRHLQALAGLEIGLPVHLPDTDCTQDQVRAAVEALIRKDDRLHIYDHYGSDDPEVLLDAIRFLVSARGCRYVLLDHISMVVSGSADRDERKSLDRIMTKLEMMVKELDFALIVVSHVNDEGMTRGSRYISKIAHLRIDLKRNVLANDPVTRNTTFLTISKNRYGRRTGPAGALLFNLDTHSYEEIAHANENYPSSDGTNAVVNF